MANLGNNCTDLGRKCDFEAQNCKYAKVEGSVGSRLEQERSKLVDRDNYGSNRDCIESSKNTQGGDTKKKTTAHSNCDLEKNKRVKGSISTKNRHQSLRPSFPLDKETFNVIFPAKNGKICKNPDTSRYKDKSSLKRDLWEDSNGEATSRDLSHGNSSKKTLRKFSSFHKNLKRTTSREKRDTIRGQLVEFGVRKRDPEKDRFKRKTSAKASTQDSDKAVKRYHSQASNTKNETDLKTKNEYYLMARPPPISTNIPSKVDDAYSIFSNNLLNFENRIRGSTSGEKHKYKRSARKLLLESINGEPNTNNSMHSHSKIKKLPQVFVAGTPVKRKMVGPSKNMQSYKEKSSFPNNFSVDKTQEYNLPSLKNLKEDPDKSSKAGNCKTGKNIPRSLSQPRYNLVANARSTEEGLTHTFFGHKKRLESSISTNLKKSAQERQHNLSNHNISEVGALSNRFESGVNLKKHRGRIYKKAHNLSCSNNYKEPNMVLREFGIGQNLVGDLKHCANAKISKTPANFVNTMATEAEDNLSTRYKSTQLRYNSEKSDNIHQKSVILYNRQNCLSQESGDLVSKKSNNTNLDMDKNQYFKSRYTSQPKITTPNLSQGSKNKEFMIKFKNPIKKQTNNITALNSKNGEPLFKKPSKLKLVSKLDLKQDKALHEALPLDNTHTHSPQKNFGLRMNTEMKLTNRAKRLDDLLKTQRSSKKTTGFIRKLQSLQTTAKRQKGVTSSNVKKTGEARNTSKVYNMEYPEDLGELKSNASTKKPYQFSQHLDNSGRECNLKEVKQSFEEVFCSKVIRDDSSDECYKADDKITEENESSFSNYQYESWFENLPEMEIDSEDEQEPPMKANTSMRKEMNDTMKGFLPKSKTQKKKKDKFRDTAIFGDIPQNICSDSDCEIPESSTISNNLQGSIDLVGLRSQLNLAPIITGEELKLVPKLDDGDHCLQSLKPCVYEMKYKPSWVEPSLEMFKF
ncbi:unnamed protein product [Moneuplotes crassus]|uniref:Uncharacterized protein n=1 Tax=Euplotes crassus TaxID=5936 RepID=A0AAD1XCG8_EUPCR|nr:unnamed protein product [Moneuplotes crassus]